MLGVQNPLLINNLRFKGFDNSSEEVSFEEIPDLQDQENDSFCSEQTETKSPEQLAEEERNKKLTEIEETRKSIDELADNLENTPSKVSKKAGKLLRFASTVFGLAGTFVIAKYSSKVTISSLRNLKNTPLGKNTIEPLKNGMGSAWGSIKNTIRPAINSFKETTVGKSIKEFMEKPKIKAIKETLEGYKEATTTLIESINGDKIQNGLENTMAASTTASVLIDDLAGRNNNKSNLDLALGASGGDR